jgi:uncharacterized protein
MGIDPELIQEIVRRVVSVSQPVKVILFGSAAIGQMTKDSDVDLLVIEKSVDNPMLQSVRIQDALRGLGYPFDVIVMTSDRFEETKNVIGGISYPAVKHGQIIYEAA